MITTILFAGSFFMLVAAIVVYLLKDDTTTKRWAEHTKAMTVQNEKLAKDWQEAIEIAKGLAGNHGILAAELERQKHQIDKIQFGVTVQNKPTTMKIDFEPIKVVNFTPQRTVKKKAPAKKKVAKKVTKKAVKKVTIKKKKTKKKSYSNGATKATPAQKRLMKKTANKMRQLNQ